MSLDNDTSTDFSQRPEVPKEYVDTADLMEAVTGQRPMYSYDVSDGEWCMSSSADTGIWPDVYGYMLGVEDSGDGVSVLFSIEERPDGSCVWLHLRGSFGEVRITPTGDDAKLLRKLHKEAFRRVKVADAYHSLHAR